MGKVRLSGCVCALVALGLVVLPQLQADCAENIILAGEVVARIHDPGGFGSVFSRAAQIDKRIVNAISHENVGTPNMYIIPGQNPAIYIGKTLVMRAYAGDARAKGMSQLQLARSWQANLAKQFPLSEPTTLMGRDRSQGELARAAEKTTQAAQRVKVPAADWALVTVAMNYLEKARAIKGAEFPQKLPALKAALYATLSRGILDQQAGKVPLQPPHYPGTCPELGGCPGCKAVITAAVASAKAVCPEPGGSVPPMSPAVSRRVGAGLKLVHNLKPERYQQDRVMIAVTLLKVMRKSLLVKPSPPPRRAADPWSTP